MSGWSLSTISFGSVAKGATVAAIRRADGSHVVPDLLRPYAGLLEALEDWEGLEGPLRQLDVSALPAVAGQERLSVRYPRKLLCVGANYRDHVAEMGVTDIPDGTQPYFFSVPPTTAMIGSGETIIIPEDPALGIDWEAELAVVIGIGGRDISVESALEHVAGYACFNDVTARALMRRTTPLAVPFTWDWLGSKGLDTFCPMGPVTPAWQVPDPDDLGIRCLVDGELKQDGSTRSLIVGVAELISWASRSWSLEPGDVIATGTPAGVGHIRGERLGDGSQVRVEIDRLAPLVNRVAVRQSTYSTAPALQAD